MKPLLVAPPGADHAHHQHPLRPQRSGHPDMTVLSGTVGYRLAVAAAATGLLWAMVGWALG